jgi:nickel-dependent lactate racemase
MALKVNFPYEGYSPAYIPEESLLAILKPKSRRGTRQREIDLIRGALERPIGLPRLKGLVRKDQKILILVDDYTRNTPTQLILPPVIEELTGAGVLRKDIKLMVSSGLHRLMTHEEKVRKVGKDIMETYEVMDHEWNKTDSLVQLPTTSQGTEIWVNKEILAADFVIGIGHIVPHRVAGFAGGAKIVQPGVCGAVTTDQTHWLSACYQSSEIFGKIDNPIRQEINEVGTRAGLKFIVNTIHDGKGKIRRCVCGDPVEAFRRGCRTASDIYGAPLPALAEIVLVDSYPGDVELWQAGKAIFAAELALKPDGILILVSPCPEGVCRSHPQLAEIGYMPFAEIEAKVKQGGIKDLTLASHIAKVGRVICDRGIGVLVSDGIDAATARRLGFKWAETAQEALDLAFKVKGEDAKVAVLQHGGEVMPLVDA